MFTTYVDDLQTCELCEAFGRVIEDSLAQFDYGRALELAGEWLFRLDSLPLQETLANQKAAVRLWRAELLAQLQRWDQASEEADGILCRRSLIGEKALLVRALLLSAQIHGVYGEQEQAMKSLEEARQLDPQGAFRAQAELEQARLLIRSGDLESALELVRLEAGCLDESAIERGRVLFRLHRFEEARAAWFHVLEKSAYQQGTKAPPDRFQAECLRLLGLLHQEMAEPQQALIYLERALAAFWRLKLWIGVAKAYEGLGQVCSDLGRLTEALHFTYKAERLSRRLGAESELAVVYGRLGNLCMKLGDYQRAIRFHELDVELCRRFGNYRALAYALSSLGLSYRAQGDLKLAYELLSESLDRFLQLAERGPILRVRIERARTLIERNLLEEAHLDLQSASWMLGQGTAAADSAAIYVLYARLERLQGRPQEAQQHLEFAYQVLETVGKDAFLRCEALREEAYLALSQGDLEAASKAFASAVSYARKGEQQAIWQECLEQLDRLDELMGSSTVLEGLHREAWESGELTEVNPLIAMVE